MRDRIKIDGEWYVREKAPAPKEKEVPIFFVGVSSGRFEFSVLQSEDIPTKPWENTQRVTVAEGKDIDNVLFLRNFRDNKHDTSQLEEFSSEELTELRYLLLTATAKGWL